MCFSVEVEKELKKIATRFNASESLEDYAHFSKMKLMQNDKDWIKKQLSLKQKPRSNFFREPDADNRIFPGYFAPVIINENGHRVIKPMRYRLRPEKSNEEIPTKFNVFNARLDSLEVRQTWKPLFMKKHGLFPFRKFFEWVEFEGKPKLIVFNPEEKELMWAPCLWDKWESPDKTLHFYSFALITDEPPVEVLSKGHDRCPIFLKEKFIDDWLNPNRLQSFEMKEILRNKEDVYYGSSWVA